MLAVAGSRIPTIVPPLPSSDTISDGVTRLYAATSSAAFRAASCGVRCRKGRWLCPLERPGCLALHRLVEPQMRQDRARHVCLVESSPASLPGGADDDKVPGRSQVVTTPPPRRLRYIVGLGRKNAATGLRLSRRDRCGPGALNWHYSRVTGNAPIVFAGPGRSSWCDTATYTVTADVVKVTLYADETPSGNVNVTREIYAEGRHPRGCCR